VTTRPQDFRIALHVLVVTEDLATAQLVERTLAGSSDLAGVAGDLSEGLSKALAEVPDIVLVDLGLGNNAGLAVVHHLRALGTATSIYAMTGPQSLELGPQAMALGASGVLVLPLSGDEIVRTVGTVRAELADRAERTHLRKQAAVAEQARGFSEALADISNANSRRDAAERVALLLSQAGASQVAVYLPTGEGSRQWMRLGRVGRVDSAPSFAEEMEVLVWAQEEGFEVVRLVLRRQSVCLVLLENGLGPGVSAVVDMLGIVGTQVATALCLVAEREQSSRGAMKDPHSSAYTFAYFVDVTGREIDKARRYGRRFALATLGIDLPKSTDSHAAADPGTQIVEQVLASVRDTDVLARVDEGEFYLLLPETGGTGAHICRRRVMRQLQGSMELFAQGSPGIDIAMGVATFPQDGLDLSQLLRIARHRAEVCRHSPVRRLGLNRLSLPEILDALLWRLDEAAQGLGMEAPRMINLPILDAVSLATAAVNEACRGGETRVVASVHPGMSIGGAVRGSLGPDRDQLRVEIVDLGAHAACRELEVLVVVAEHGVYSLIGRSSGGTLRALHSAEPVLADLLVQRLGELVRMRLLD
jgi:diguanylate cyclase (GGDEF)-like protein